MQVLEVLQEVTDLARLHEVRLRMLVARGADQLVGEHRVRDGGALVRFLGLHQRHVRETGRATRLVLTAGHGADVVEEQRRRSHDGEVLLARPDQCVPRFVGAQVRVDEVDLHLAAGQAAATVDELRERPDTAHDPLEETRPHRIVDVGDHCDADRVLAHADFRVLQWLGLSRRGHSTGWHE